MHSRAVRIKGVGLLTIRPLRRGDTQTVAAVFGRLGTDSPGCHAELAKVDGRRHTLVAYVEGDPEPAGIAQLVRDRDRWTDGEIALAVADRYQRRCIGSTLVELLAADARAAGITQLKALARPVANVADARHQAGEEAIVATLEPA